MWCCQPLWGQKYISKRSAASFLTFPCIRNVKLDESMIWQVTFWARIKFSLVPGFRDLLTFAHLVWILICILIIGVNRVLKYEHFQGYFVVLWLILPEIQWFLFNIPLNLGSKRASMSMAYVIFSVIAGLPKVYQTFWMCHIVYFNNMKRNLGHLSRTRKPPQPKDYHREDSSGKKTRGWYCRGYVRYQAQ